LRRGDSRRDSSQYDGHDPCFFLKQAHGKNPVQSDLDLRNFIHGGSWDEQRILNDPNINFNGNGIDKTFRDYATIAIGLYSAASGESLNASLSDQDLLAVFMSSFQEKPAPGMLKLPQRNVDNTSTGYNLFKAYSLVCCA
jgi:hypothetical protein